MILSATATPEPAGRSRHVFSWSSELSVGRGVGNEVSRLGDHRNGVLAPPRGLSYCIYGVVAVADGEPLSGREADRDDENGRRTHSSRRSEGDGSADSPSRISATGRAASVGVAEVTVACNELSLAQPAVTIISTKEDSEVTVRKLMASPVSRAGPGSETRPRKQCSAHDLTDLCGLPRTSLLESVRMEVGKLRTLLPQWLLAFPVACRECTERSVCGEDFEVQRFRARDGIRGT